MRFESLSTRFAGRGRVRAMSMGWWLTLGVAASVFAVAAEAPATESSPDPVAAVQAGPVDDTMDYIECLIRRLLDLPCDSDVPLPDDAE